MTGARIAAGDFEITDRPALDVLSGNYQRDFADDPERCEYFAPVQWDNTLMLRNAVQEVKLFGDQDTVCKPVSPKWRSTVERLKEVFAQA